MFRTSALFALAGLLLSHEPGAQTTIVQGQAPSGLARTMNNNDNSVAVTPDGAVYAVVYLSDSAGTNGHLELRRSTDQGQTWPNAYALPNNTSHNNHHNNSGCIVAGRDADKLHVAWADKTANASYWSAMYQVFDTKNLTWIGTPTLLAQGTGANNQFWPVDIAMTPKGTIVVCISGHRSGGLGLGSWDCGLAVKKRDDTAFNSTLFNLRNGGASYSQNASIVAVDEKVHCCMKNATGGYGIAYRRFDAEQKTWDQTSQVLVGPNNNAGIAAGNKSVIAADRDGGIYILYVTGSSSAKRTLRLAYAPPGKGDVNTDWQDIEVIPDTATIGTNYRNVATNNGAYPQIQGGNSTYRNYSLAWAGGKEMTVVYSKAFEVFADLYVRSYVAGAPALPELKISPNNSKPYSYEWITGMRNGDYVYVPVWLTHGKTDAPAPNNGTFPNGRVEYGRLSNDSVARSIPFATGCQGQLAMRPRMHAHGSLPRLGSTLTVVLDRSPANVNLFLAAGVTPLVPPLKLSFLNAASCTLDVTFPIIVGLTTSGNGDLQLPWNVPNDVNLNGVPVYTQALLVAPNSTPGNVVTSNALCAVLGK